MKYGFIGAGNIAEAIIKGMIKSNTVKPTDIYFYEPNIERCRTVCDMFSPSSLNATEASAKVAEICDIVFLTVKPDILSTVLKEISGTVKTHRPLIISIAAGKTLSFIEQHLGFSTGIICAMPNTNAAVGESMTLICPNEHITENQLEITENCFKAIGKTYNTTEDKLPILTAISGCSPAFTYLFIESLAKAAHKNGINKKRARVVRFRARVAIIIFYSGRLISVANTPSSLCLFTNPPYFATIRSIRFIPKPCK